MITGLYRNAKERFENAAINTCMISQIGTVLLKVAGLSQLSWLATFVPIFTLIGIVLVSIAIVKVYTLILRLRDTYNLLRYQKEQMKHNGQTR